MMVSGGNELGNPLKKTAVQLAEVSCLPVCNVAAELGIRLGTCLQLLLSQALHPLDCKEGAKRTHSTVSSINCSLPRDLSLVGNQPMTIKVCRVMICYFCDSAFIVYLPCVDISHKCGYG